MKILASFSVLLMLLIFWGNAVVPAEVPLSVRVGIYQNPPKIFQDEQGDPQGFWVHLLDTIARDEDWTITYVPCEWDLCLQQVEAGQLDLMVDVAYSDDRSRRFDFNHEVVVSGWSVVYTRPQLNLDSILSLDGKRVAVLQGSIQADQLASQSQAYNIAPRVVAVDSFEKMFQMLESSQVEAAIVNRFFGSQMDSQYGVVKTHILLDPYRLHFIVPRGDPLQLLPQIDRNLEQQLLNRNSPYYELFDRWLEPPPRWTWRRFKRLLLNLLIYVPPILLAIVALWNRSLRQEIQRRREAEQKLQMSEHRYALLTEASPVGIFTANSQGECTYVNNHWVTITGHPSSVGLGHGWQQVIYHEDLPLLRAAWHQAQVLHQPVRMEYRIQRPQGELVWVYGQVIGAMGEMGAIHYLGTITDITDLKQATEKLQDSEQRFRLAEERLRIVTENMSDLVCLHDPDGCFQYVTPSSESVLGYSPHELVGRDPLSLCHPDDRYHLQQLFLNPTPDTIPQRLVYRASTKFGDYLWLETLPKLIQNDQGQIIHIQTTSRNISDRLKVEEQLKYAALHDTLTGLPNRSLLMERLDLVLKRMTRQPRLQFAVLFFDLDHFKFINDSLGHSAGDQLLRTIAKLLEKFIRDTDVAARLGGDEFVVLLEKIEGLADVVQVADRILEAIQAPINLQQQDIFISTSIGIVLGNHDYTSTEELLRDADVAMYQAKHQGRGQYAIFNPTMYEHLMDRLALENDLRQALDRGEFVLYYQPIVCLRTQEIYGFEALLRWQHPKRGLILPGEFLGAMEETGLIIPVGQWILQCACAQLDQWQQNYPDRCLRISLNLSLKELQSLNLDLIRQHLTTYNLQGQNLILEITESILVKNMEASFLILKEIHDQGIHISIDDFGTGYSSLRYLHKLPVYALKIDRSFVSQSPDYDCSDVVTESIITLSKVLRLKAIAEGVETPEQLNWLRTLGCELGQGFLFSPPLSSDRATDFLKTSSNQPNP